MSPDRVSRIIEQELDTTIADLFESIDLKNPLGAASIAQVQGPHAQHVCLAAADIRPAAAAYQAMLMLASMSGRLRLGAANLHQRAATLVGLRCRCTRAS